MQNLSFLPRSLEQLRGITKQSYNNSIKQVALELWEKHLQPENPQWQYITAKPFFLQTGKDSAHVMAMLDSRLPNIGIVGYFACTSSELGAEVLEKASAWLKKTYDIKDVYGPINGTLPSDYRLNLHDDFCFPGEPVNPTWHIEAFEKAGFGTFNHYASGTSKHYRFFMKLAIRKPKKGYRHMYVRPFRVDAYEKDFAIYHELRNQVFPLQSVYCPAISLRERIYHTNNKFDTQYTHFLVDNGTEVGFVMAYPYKGQLIVKTLAVLPEYRGKKVSGLLLKPVRDMAITQNLQPAIYAMVRAGNAVSNAKKPGVKVYRHYVTMRKKV